MLLTIKESASLYVMDLVFSNLAGSLGEYSSTIENTDTWHTSLFNDEDAQISNKRSEEDIMLLLRH